MSSSSKPRIVRKHNPKKLYTRATYRKALPLLLEDFEGRCAYSLVHYKMIGESEMHVDHHDPSKKRRSRYSNLFPAYGLCNEAKSDSWPLPKQQAAGIRFLNPCLEQDYGEQIFEDPATHELIGSTAAARYHIEMIDLNHPALIEQRKERSELAAILNSPLISKSAITPNRDDERAEIADRILRIMKYKIPPIPSQPVSGICS